MTASPTRRRRRRTVQHLLIGLACLVAVDAFVGEKGLLAIIEARRQYRALEASLAQVRAENARLRDEAERLRLDPAAIEEIARRELGLMRPGETLFIIRNVPRPR